MRKTVSCMMSAGYCPDWGAANMLREVIANALDTRTEVDITCRAGKVTVTDRGGGFPPSCLMLGEGEDKDSGAIGRFKEGSLLAVLVAARLGLRFSLRSSQFDILSADFADGDLGARTLTLELELHEQHRRSPETAVTIDGVDRLDFDAAVATFEGLRVNGRVMARIPGGCAPAANKKLGGRVYVNRVLCHQEKELMYDYSFNGADERYKTIKEGMNRDRSELSGWRLRDALRLHWINQAPAVLAAALQSFKPGTVEYEALTRDVRYVDSAAYKDRLWLALALVLHTDLDWEQTHVLHTDRDASTVCERHGLLVYRPGNRRNAAVSLLTSNMTTDRVRADELLERHKREAKRQAQQTGDRIAVADTVFVPWQSLAPHEQHVMEGACQLLCRAGLAGHTDPAVDDALNGYRTAAWRRTTAGVFESAGGCDASGICIREVRVDPEEMRRIHPGRHRGTTAVIGVRRDKLKPGNEAEVAAILAHEVAHVDSRAQDGTVEFELSLTESWEKLAKVAIGQCAIDPYEDACPDELSFGAIRTMFRSRYRPGGAGQEQLSGFGRADLSGEMWRHYGHYYVERVSRRNSGVLEGHLFVGRTAGLLRRLVVTVDKTSGPNKLTFGRLGPRSTMPWYGAVLTFSASRAFGCDGVFVGWRECDLMSSLSPGQVTWVAAHQERKG